MRNRIKLVNFYLTSIQTGSSIDSISNSGTFNVSDTSMSGYDLPQGDCLLWVVVDV